jgi:hypothetical protein
MRDDRGPLDLRWPEPKQDKRARRWAWVVAIIVTLLGALALAASVGDLRPRDLMFWHREQITYIQPTPPVATPDTVRRDSSRPQR